MSLPMPSTVSELPDLASALNAATHEQRLQWAYSLGQTEQLALFGLASETTLTVDDLTKPEGAVFVHPGRNGLPLFNRFQKRFARLGDEVVGYNHNDNALLSWFAGPGHFTAYTSPDTGREVWIDYRTVSTQQHSEFPPLVDNEQGGRALVFGNMVDKLRRVSSHVLIGNAYKDLPAKRTPTLAMRIGMSMATAPFVLVQPA